MLKTGDIHSPKMEKFRKQFKLSCGGFRGRRVRFCFRMRQGEGRGGGKSVFTANSFRVLSLLG